MKESKHDYCSRILEMYARLPHTPDRPRRQDLQLVSRLYDQGITCELIEAAMLLAVARRLARPPDTLPLPTIRSMYYFIPVIDELQAQPLPADYMGYLRSKVGTEKNRVLRGRSRELISIPLPQSEDQLEIGCSPKKPPFLMIANKKRRGDQKACPEKNFRPD